MIAFLAVGLGLPFILCAMQERWPLNAVVLVLYIPVVAVMVAVAATYFRAPLVMEILISLLASVLLVSPLVFFTRWRFVTGPWSFLLGMPVAVAAAGVMQAVWPQGSNMNILWCWLASLVFWLWMVNQSLQPRAVLPRDMITPIPVPYYTDGVWAYSALNPFMVRMPCGSHAHAVPLVSS